MICIIRDMEVYPSLNIRVYRVDAEIYSGTDTIGINLGPQHTEHDAQALQNAVGSIKRFTQSLHDLHVILFVIFQAREFVIQSSSTDWATLEPKIFKALGEA